MTFGSVYEILNPLTVIRKQRFWDWFDGQQLKAWWNTHDVSGGDGADAMADVVDGGFGLFSGTAANNYRQMDFNNIRHYDQNGCVMIIIARTVTGIEDQFRHGYGFTDNLSATGFNTCSIENGDEINYTLFCNDASGGGSFLSSGVALDLVFHTWSMKLNGTNFRVFDGSTLKGTISTNLPAGKLQPYIFAQTRTASARETRLRYVEIFNT